MECEVRTLHSFDFIGPRLTKTCVSLQLFHTVEIRNPVDNVIASTLVVATVKYIHMRNDVLDPVRGIPDPGKLKPVAKMGGISYARVTEGFTLPRAPIWTTIVEGQRAFEEEAVKLP